MTELQHRTAQDVLPGSRVRIDFYLAQELVETARITVLAALRKYPDRVLRKHVGLVNVRDQVFSRGLAVGGFADYNTYQAYYAESMFPDAERSDEEKSTIEVKYSSSKEQTQNTVHHEIAHLVYTHYRGSVSWAQGTLSRVFRDDDWRAANPSWFQYGDGGHAYVKQGSECDLSDEQLYEAGFIRHYATSGSG